MSESDVLVEINQGIANLILNRVEKHNALNANMIQLLSKHLDELAQNSDVHVVWLTSKSKHFCAGADLNWMKQSAAYTLEENYEDAKQLGELLETLYRYPKPTLATVQGACYGGAIGLIACCDIALCANTAKFCFSEAKLGIIPAMISPYIINAIGTRQANAHFITTEVFDGPKAYEMGLCYDVVSEEGLMERSHTLLKNILLNGPLALKSCKSLVQRLQNHPIDSALTELTAKLIAQMRTSDEGQEGLSAFLEKRKPSWVKESL